MADKVAPLTFAESKSFNREYFSGANIKIYFGDILIDEVTSLEYTLTEQIAPIFGFQSYTWDKVARGNRYVQGSFSINFKEVGYLQTAINRLTSNLKGGQENQTSGYFDKKFWTDNKTKPLEVIMSQDKDKKIGSYYSMVKEMESAFWGEGETPDYAKARPETTYFYPVHELMDNKGSERMMRENGFNILVEFRDPTAENCSEYEFKNSTYTVQTIIGVQLQSKGKQITSQAQEVQEVYTFLARDIDGYMPAGSLSKLV